MTFRTNLENQLFPLIKKIAPFVVAGGIALTSCKAQPVQTPVQPPVQPPVQTYTLQGTAYHDYNGDGIKEENEPVIPELEMGLFSKTLPPKTVRDIYPVKVHVPSSGSGDSVTYEIQLKTDSNGSYSIQLPEGEYELYVDKNNILGPNNQPYRYIAISKAEFRRITDPLEIEVKVDMNYNVGAMQGFLTLPFGPDTKFLGNNEFGIEYYADRDNRPGYIRDWKGESCEVPLGHVTCDAVRTYDTHTGTDFYMEENTPILAAAPGVVITQTFDILPGHSVVIEHESPYNEYENISTGYGHLNTVNVKIGDKVNRGDVIGLSGGVLILKPGFRPGKHLHFAVLLVNSYTPSSFEGKYTDPYRNIVPMEWSSEGLWTVDNNPQYANLNH